MRINLLSQQSKPKKFKQKSSQWYRIPKEAKKNSSLVWLAFILRSICPNCGEHIDDHTEETYKQHQIEYDLLFEKRLQNRKKSLHKSFIIYYTFITMYYFIRLIFTYQSFSIFGLIVTVVCFFLFGSFTCFTIKQYKLKYKLFHDIKVE